MRHVSRIVSTAVAVLCAADLGLAAEQTVLGKSLTVRDPKPGVDPAKRRVSVSGKEKHSSNTLVGDPTQTGAAGGALLELTADGANAISQIFVLQQGTSSTGQQFWSGSATTGFKYKDSMGDQGAVKSVRISRSGGGSFSIKITASGKGGPLALLPPNPGTGGCAALTLGSTAGAGDRYSLRFGSDSTIKNSAGTLFSAKAPATEGVCPTLTPCDAGPFPTCGGTCPDGDGCGAVDDGTDQSCACFTPGDACGDSCDYVCASPQECDAQLAGCESSLAGQCPPGLICKIAIGDIMPCPGGNCVHVVGMCAP